MGAGRATGAHTCVEGPVSTSSRLASYCEKPLRTTWFLFRPRHRRSAAKQHSREPHFPRQFDHTVKE